MKNIKIKKHCSTMMRMQEGLVKYYQHKDQDKVIVIQKGNDGKTGTPKVSTKIKKYIQNKPSGGGVKSGGSGKC